VSDPTWSELAKDLAESGSAIVSEIRGGRTPSPFVLSLFLEACTAYDRKVASESSEELSLPVCGCGGSQHLDCIGIEGGKASVTTIHP